MMTERKQCNLGAVLVFHREGINSITSEMFTGWNAAKGPHLGDFVIFGRNNIVYEPEYFRAVLNIEYHGIFHVDIRTEKLFLEGM